MHPRRHPTPSSLCSRRIRCFLSFCDRFFGCETVSYLPHTPTEKSQIQSNSIHPTLRVLHCIASHLISSHRIASHRISSHRIASHLISSHLISSLRIASYLILSHLIASHHIASPPAPFQSSSVSIVGSNETAQPPTKNRANPPTLHSYIYFANRPHF